VTGVSPHSVGSDTRTDKRNAKHPLLRLARSAAIYLTLLVLVGLGLAGAEWLAGIAGLKSGHTQFLRFALLGIYGLAALALLGRSKR